MKKMASLHEISCRLMKPPKDTSEWTFPMSEILDDYNRTLLRETEDLRFGEAALVIQNSANIYEKRVERLHTDTLSLSKSFHDHEEQAELEKEKKKERKKRKNQFDFKNFEHVDFSQDISSKSINEKLNKERKKVKLISPRYPQLEKGLSLKFSLDIIDVAGEVIGKKYDYRLNGHLTSSYMLVDEVTPDEFVNDQTEAAAGSSEGQEEIPGEKDYCDYSEDCRDCQVFSPFAESGYETISETPSSRGNLSNYSHNFDDERVFLPSPLMPEASPDSGVESQESGIDPQDCLNTPPAPESTLKEEQPEESSETSASSLKNSKTRESFETDAGYDSPGDLDDVNQTSTQETPAINEEPQIVETESSQKSLQSPRHRETIKRSFEPFPVTEIPDVTPDPDVTPCDPVQLKRRVSTKKRKSPAENVPRKKIKKQQENSVDKTKKRRVLSPDRKSCESMKKELKELKILLKDIFQNKLNSTYEAVGTDDLLGFRPRLSKENSIIDGALDPEECQDKTEEDEEREEPVDPMDLDDDRLGPPPEASCSYTPPHSPDYPDQQGYSDAVELFDNHASHQERVERRMKQLQNEFDIRNDRTGETEKWLQSMEVLRAAERRPIFNVHHYENRVIDTLKNSNGSCVSFEEIVAREEPDDIARLFLASLHLANTHNVDIQVTTDDTHFSNVNLSLISSNLR